MNWRLWSFNLPFSERSECGGCCLLLTPEEIRRTPTSLDNLFLTDMIPAGMLTSNDNDLTELMPIELLTPLRGLAAVTYLMLTGFKIIQSRPTEKTYIEGSFKLIILKFVPTEQ